MDFYIKTEAVKVIITTFVQDTLFIEETSGFVIHHGTSDRRIVCFSENGDEIPLTQPLPEGTVDLFGWVQTGPSDLMKEMVHEKDVQI